MGYDHPILAESLIRNRDGIVGSWEPPGAIPTPLVLDDPANLEYWEPWVRAQIFDFEMFSRLGFTAETAGDGVSIWHLEANPAADPPGAVYEPLVKMTRPGEATFKEQLAFLNSYADLRPDRAPEILAQLGMPTAFLASIAFLRPDRTRWTLELLDAAFRLAVFVEMRIKHALACRRPVEFSPQVQPVIMTPGHGALPSGHATEAHALALVLWNLLQAGNSPVYQHVSYGVQLLRQASRIAINRTVAGVHFPVDSVAGAILGLTLGQYLVNRCRGDNNYHAHEFNGAAYPGNEDFTWIEIFDVEANPPAVKHTADYVTDLAQQNLSEAGHSPALSWLWSKAVAEWTDSIAGNGGDNDDDD